jgi:hypothetical protein
MTAASAWNLALLASLTAVAVSPLSAAAWACFRNFSVSLQIQLFALAFLIAPLAVAMAAVASGLAFEADPFDCWAEQPMLSADVSNATVNSLTGRRIFIDSTPVGF